MSRQQFILALSLVGLPVAVACGAAEDEGTSENLFGPVTTVPDSDSAASGGSQATSGVLTAGLWDDNQNFDIFTAYRSDRFKQGSAGLLQFSESDHEQAHLQSLEQTPTREQLDILLMLDTTGSMGDELRYLQSEFLAISDAIQTRFPNSDQRWALILYRDQGDAYVTKQLPFTNDGEAFQGTLAAQSVDGGGDFPEAPDAAFKQLNQLDWRSGESVAKVAFWVADAPHHEENALALTNALRQTQELGVHVYPIASSGIDEHTELTMRSAAQLTGGRYLFLTDDSGVGLSHKTASVPCYYVTRLNDALLRAIDVELSGDYRAPTADELIRSVGTPVEGKCALDAQRIATAF